jgi:hypothetical protein
MRRGVPVVVCILMLVTSGCGLANRGCQNCTVSGGGVKVTFPDREVGKVPEGFVTATTHEGPNGQWVVVKDGDRKVLAQVSDDPTKARYPLCIYSGLKADDVAVSAKFKAVSGKVDQAAGLVARYKDKDNYYLTRANALEANTRLYKVVAGKRIMIADANMPVTSGVWHDLRLEVVGTRMKVYYDGKQVIEAQDATFTEPGCAGLWTKADSVTYFDDIIIDPQQTLKGR